MSPLSRPLFTSGGGRLPLKPRSEGGTGVKGCLPNSDERRAATFSAPPLQRFRRFVQDFCGVVLRQEVEVGVQDRTGAHMLSSEALRGAVGSLHIASEGSCRFLKVILLDRPSAFSWATLLAVPS